MLKIRTSEFQVIFFLRTALQSRVIVHDKKLTNLLFIKMLVVGVEEDGRDEEEMWLAAVEEGNLARLESVDSELRYGRY